MLDSLVGLAAGSERVVLSSSHNSVVMDDRPSSHNTSNVFDSVHNLSRVFD
jgi:molybdopterin-guanine dinucleotide biosynthesis protein